MHKMIYERANAIYFAKKLIVVFIVWVYYGRNKIGPYNDMLYIKYIELILPH